MAENRSLEILTQAGSKIEIKGEMLEIKPVRLAALADLTNALQGIAKDVLALLAPDNGIIFERGKEIEINAEGWQLIQTAIANNIDSLATIMSIYTRRPKEWFLDEETGIDIEDTMVLLIAIVERHYDFFMMRLSPILGKLRAKTAQKK